MRTCRLRRLIGTAALSVGAVAVAASPAFGAVEIEGAEFDDKFAEECAELLIEGGTVDECQEAPHPLLPEMKELIWGGLAFLVVFGILAKFAFPALRKAVHAREEKIRGDVEEAESARSAAEETKATYERRLAEARLEAGRIIEESRQAADEVRRELIAQAEADAGDVRERAQEDIRLMTQRAMSDLRDNVAVMSIELAEKVVERSLDAETQRALIDSYIDQVGSSNGHERSP